MIKQKVSGTVYGVVLNDHASVRKIGDALDTAQFLPIEIGVKRRAARIQRKSRMRLVTDAGTDAEFVDAGGDGRGGGIRRQQLSLCVIKTRLRHGLGEVEGIERVQGRLRQRLVESDVDEQDRARAIATG